MVGTNSEDTMATETRHIDWEAIELDYRAGIKTLRQIAEEHGVTHVAINKRAKKSGWTRDLKEKIKAKADALVAREVVHLASEASEREVVEANAQQQASVALRERVDITRSRSLAMALIEELETQTRPEMLEQLRGLGKLMRNQDGPDKLNDLYQFVISLPGRSKTMKDLTTSLQALITMERRAYGLDDDDGRRQGSGIEDLLREVRDAAQS